MTRPRIVVVLVNCQLVPTVALRVKAHRVVAESAVHLVHAALYRVIESGSYPSLRDLPREVLAEDIPGRGVKHDSVGIRRVLHELIRILKGLEELLRFGGQFIALLLKRVCDVVKVAHHTRLAVVIRVFRLDALGHLIQLFKRPALITCAVLLHCVEEGHDLEDAVLKVLILSHNVVFFRGVTEVGERVVQVTGALGHAGRSRFLLLVGHVVVPFTGVGVHTARRKVREINQSFQVLDVLCSLTLRRLLQQLCGLDSAVGPRIDAIKSCEPFSISSSAFKLRRGKEIITGRRCVPGVKDSVFNAVIQAQRLPSRVLGQLV